MADLRRSNGPLSGLDLPDANGALGEAITSLDTLAAELRSALKGMPPVPREDAAETIQALGLRLVIEGVQPFLLEWRPRYRRYLASGRPETKWRRAAECRAALMAARERCRPLIEAIGRQVGAPLSKSVSRVTGAAEEPPLQLPAPTPQTSGERNQQLA